MPPKRDLTAARLRRMGADAANIDTLKADKAHAERLAKLAASASSRRAAPLPPGQGGEAPKPAAAPAASPAQVEKFRAIEEFKSEELTMEKGATVFVVGMPDADNNVQAVAGGKAGKVPFDKLRKITPELLEEERKQREKDIEEACRAEEEELKKEMERMKLEGKDGSSEAAAAESAKGEERSPEQLAYEKELEDKFVKERESLLSEEQRLKEEAAKLEAMLRALDEE